MRTSTSHVTQARAWTVLAVQKDVHGVEGSVFAARRAEKHADFFVVERKVHRRCNGMERRERH